VFNFMVDNSIRYAAGGRAPYMDGSIAINTYRNLFDTTVGGNAAVNSPGFHAQELYHNSVAEAEVNMKLAVRAEANPFSGPAAQNGVRVIDGVGNFIEVTGIGALAWYTATGTMPASAAYKVDVQAKAAILDRVNVYAVSLFEVD
jgi:hypothetical protein